jgi:hypothetical protein
MCRYIPIPFTPSGLPVNLGPFLLLVVTKLILPKSSFVGHLSGIVIGYPLAWNVLDFLTPPVFLSIICLLYLYSRQLFFFKLPGYEVGRLCVLIDALYKCIH